jgi:nucleotide-binding universal stress UspA family protein
MTEHGWVTGDDESAPFERILVPLGRAGSGDRALAVAHRLAARVGVPVRALRVSPPLAAGARGTRPPTGGPGRPAAIGATTAVVAYGSVAAAIAAEIEPGTLVCMPSHGAYGPAHTLAGGVTDAVLHTLRIPVLLVGPRVTPGVALDTGRVVACLDESPASERVQPPARRWSRALDLPLWLVHVAPPGEGSDGWESDAERPTGRRLDALAHAVPGAAGWRVLHDRRPAPSLVSLAGTGLVAVLVMATHGRTGWTRVRAGSVAASVVRDAVAPVLAVPSRAR